MNPLFFYSLAGLSGPYQKQVAYLESVTGSKMYIDTGITFDKYEDLTITATVERLTAGRSVIIGSYDATSDCINIEAYNSPASTLRLYLRTTNTGSYSTTINAGLPPNTTTTITAVYTASTGVATITNGSGQASVTTAKTTPNTLSDIWMFCDRRPDTSQILGGMRIYAATIIKGGVLVRDFIPVVDWNNIPCMYDKVSGRLFYNGGGGAFVIPPGEFPVWKQLGVFVTIPGSGGSAAMYMQNVSLLSGTSQTVFNYGVAANTTLNSTSWQIIHSGGSAINTTVSGGSQIVSSGGNAQGATVHANQVQFIIGATASNTILSGGMVQITQGGVLSGVTAYSSARVTVSIGSAFDVFLSGYFSFATVSSGYISGFRHADLDYLYVYGGGVAEDVHLISSGIGFVSPQGVISNVLLSGGTLTISSGGTGYDIDVSNGGKLTIAGTVASAIVSLGGSMTVASGGTALAVTSNAGATVNVLEGGSITYA